MPGVRSTSGRTQTFRKKVPLYQQVADVLRAQLLQGESNEPVRLPNESDLCAIHSVSRITIIKALQVLVGEGLIERVRKRGTFTIPAAVRQSKCRGQGRTICLVASGDPCKLDPLLFYGQVCRGIFDRCRQLGCNLSVQVPDKARAIPAMNLALPEGGQRVIGVLVVGIMNEETVRLYAGDYPVVCVDYWTTDARADAVVTDCYGEGQNAAEFLLRHGHSHLFYMGHSLRRRNDYQEETDSELFLAGMQRALKAAGLPPLPAERIRTFPTEDEGYQEDLDWLLSLRPAVTAGVIFSLVTCNRILEQLPSHGVRCPEDLSLMSRTIEGNASEITSMHCPVKAIGGAAVDALLDRATGRRTLPMRLVIPSTLVRGRTVRQLV